MSSDELFYSTVIVSQPLSVGDYFCFRAAKTNHNLSATNSPHVITISVSPLVTKLYTIYNWFLEILANNNNHRHYHHHHHYYHHLAEFIAIWFLSYFQ